MFAEMTQHFKDRSGASISPDEAREWIRSLVGTRSSKLKRAKEDLGENAKGLPAAPPDRGSLDIRKVLEAEFAFA